MKKISLTVTFDDVQFLFSITSFMGNIKLINQSKNPVASIEMAMNASKVLMAEKSVELYKRTYVFPVNKKLKVQFRMSEAYAFVALSAYVSFNGDQIWEKTKLNEWVAIFDKQLK